MQQPLAGRTAVVTGASRGIGAATARALAGAGARVALMARTGEQIDALAAEVGGVAVQCDLRDPAALAAGVEAVLARLGASPDIVVNNAGVAHTKAALELTDDDWRRVMDTNLDGAWRVAQAAARAMTGAGKGGSIINIASILGLRVATHLLAYNAAKAALIHATQALALEWARHRIRVNAIAPGYIETEINKGFFATEAGQAMVKRVPQRRIGKASDLDGALLLLASDAGSYMTGSVLVVDGGHVVSSL